MADFTGIRKTAQKRSFPFYANFRKLAQSG